MPARTILFTARATRELDDALAWWAEHRGTRALADALAAALMLLDRFPEMAPRVISRGRWTTTRRYILNVGGYHLYYRYDAHTRTIVVRSLWHERRPKPQV